MDLLYPPKINNGLIYLLDFEEKNLRLLKVDFSCILYNLFLTNKTKSRMNLIYF